MIAEDLVTTLGPLLSGRFYPGVAPESAAAPFGTYQLVAGVPQSDLGGASNLTNSRYQVDLYSSSKGPLDTLAASVRSAMNAAAGFASICQLQQDLYDEEAQLFRVSMDFSIWH